MNYHPLISIVVPAYNNEKTILGCLMSLKNQTYANFEIVVVDNNSTDGTRKIVEQFGTLDPRAVYCVETFQSRGAARSTGVRQARGEIIVSINADCVFDSDWLEKLTLPIRQGTADAVTGSGTYANRSYWTNQLNFLNKQFDKRYVKNGRCTATLDSKNFAAKAHILKMYNFDPTMESMDDLDLFMRLKDVTPIYFVENAEASDVDYLSFQQIVKTFFWRGYWTHLIYRKYRHQIDWHREIMFESVSFFNNATFPIWLLVKMFTCWPTRSFFIITTELSWRFGLLFYYITHY